MTHSMPIERDGVQPPARRRQPVQAREPSFQIEDRPAATFRWICVRGELSFGQLLSLMHVLGVDSETKGMSAVLLDLRLVDIAFAHRELAVAGREIACSFVHVSKLALLVPGHRVTGVSERAARREGMNMRVFTAEGKAVGWLADQ